jgi:hypothetical protein
MEQLTVAVVVGYAIKLGMVGVILLVWFVDKRESAAYRKIIDKEFERYEKDMKEIRDMYKSNVSLVKAYETTAQGLKSLAESTQEIVILNIQKITEMRASIQQNEFCPNQRLKKKRIEVAA